jgi:hypothetical protein
MVKSKRSAHLETFFRSLQEDWKGPYRKFPDQTIYALEDGRVVAAIEKRFAAQAGIQDVRQLDYDFYTGLHHLVFDFAPGMGSAGAGVADALLVILDSDCKVVAVVDPFDPVQPNKFVPPLPKESEQPFVLDRPSASKQVAFGSEALYPAQVRSRAFFERLRIGGSGGPGFNTWTLCSYQTWTPYGTVIDTVIDDCGPDEPWIIA